MVTNIPLKGVIHGKTIELEKEPGLPDGAPVQVEILLRPTLAPGEGLRRSFGAWAGNDEAVDAFLSQLREAREHDPRPESGL